MTPTPHLQAAAMRARAADHCSQVSADCKKYNLPQAAGMVASVGREILALPLEADHSELLRESVKLPEVVALIEFVMRVSDGDSADYTDNWNSALAVLKPFIASETP